jgi:hypothetical protein
MDDATIIWDLPDDPDGNTAHVAEHGLTPEEVDEVLRDDTLPVAASESSGRPCKFGFTSTGRFIVVIWDEVNDDPRMIYPVTAYDVPEPA